MTVESKFWGVMFLEIDQARSLNATIIPELFWLYNTMFVQIIHPVTLVEGGTGKVLFEHHKEREDFDNGDITSDPRYLAIIEQMQMDVYISGEPVYLEWEFNYTMGH